MRTNKVTDYEHFKIKCPDCGKVHDFTAELRLWMAARAGKAGDRKKKSEAGKRRWAEARMSTSPFDPANPPKIAKLAS